MANKQFHPEVTAIKRRSLSAPVAWLVRHHYLRSGQSKILDYGCGYGSDVLLLRDWNKGYPVQGYDPYHKDIDMTKGFPYVGNLYFDVVLCTYVLNVVDEQEQLDIIRKMWQYTRANGHLYISVRRDVAPGSTVFKHSDGTWHLQRFVELNTKYFMKIHENTKFAIYHATEYDVTRYLHDMGIFGVVEEG